MTASTDLPKSHARILFRPSDDVVLEDVADQLHELSDVCLAFELLEELFETGIGAELPAEELDRKRVAAMLRVLTEALHRRVETSLGLTNVAHDRRHPNFTHPADS